MSAVDTTAPRASAPLGADGATPARAVRVMIVVGSLEVGGAQKHIYDLVRQFDRTRLDLSIVVSQAGGYFYDRLRELGIPIHDLNVRSPRGLVMRFPAFLRHVRAVDPDVLHAFLYYPSLFACLARLVPGRRTPRLILSKRSLNLELRRDRLAIHRSVLMRVPDAITAVSEPVRQRCLELGAPPDKVRVIENGIEWIDAPASGRLRARLGLDARTPLVGAVGSLTSRKRHRELLQAMAALAADVPDAHLVIMGEGPLRPQLEADAERLGIAHRVHLPGLLAPAVDYVGDLTIFALPSSEEGMSNALLEAMMTGVPSVASDIPSNREVVTSGRDGVLVDVENPAAFAAAMRGLLADPARRAALAVQARDTIHRRFDARTMVSANEDLYVALARQRRGNRQRVAG
jgi:glycosyltransferase involved in cell wall biosynthesis